MTKFDLCAALLESQIGSEATYGQLSMAQFLSTPDGQKRLSDNLAETQKRLNALAAGATVKLNLTMDAGRRTVSGEDLFDQTVIAILDRSQPVNKTYFSLFPSERSYPQGDQPMQVGAAEAQAQMLSHIAQSGTKYARLKQTIIHNVLLAQGGPDRLKIEFNLIFDHLLPGKKFSQLRFNDFGLFKVLVHDERTNKIFDMDQMSSGEKGLVLTFLFLRLSMSKGGIVMLDEPELHLNSAVQERVLPFIKKYCIEEMPFRYFSARISAYLSER